MPSSSARAVTEVDAANLALAHLGQAPIGTLEEDNIRARSARQWLGTARESMLREKWWSFAKGWIQPASDAKQSLGPLKTRYIMPEDCLRVRYLDDGHGNIYDEESGAWDLEAAQVTISDVLIEATVLVTNITQKTLTGGGLGFWVAYTKNIKEVRLWDAVFLEAFSYELAGLMARKLARSRTMAAELHTMAHDKVMSAAAIDSKETSRKTISRTPTWVRARSGFFTWPR
jgi:hypothetical protein